jgi:AcrR family transcriptional regulator
VGRTKGFNRDEVLDKAIQLFWKQGFADTSLHDLEQATGVNKSGLYSEFKDKDDLFSECLTRYSKTNGISELLSREPLGRKNIEDFLMSGQRCADAKGCFVANSLREISIIPQKTKNQIGRHMFTVKEALIKNVAATKPAKSPAFLAELILTFSAGISLQLNAGEMTGLKKQVGEFLELILPE